MNLIKYVKKPVNIILKLDNLRIIRLPDELYLKLAYKNRMHRKLNLSNPKTFNEKLQWLKLYDRNPEYTKMVDKYEVKKYVADIIGEEHIIPTLGVYDKFDDIDFDKLPNQFVIKCTHDSGGIVVCKDKNKLDKKETKNRINKLLRKNFYYLGREWPYKNVKPRIIIEQYMGDNLTDYKIHIFNGEPKIVLVCKDRYIDDNMTEDFFDIGWKHLPVKRPGKDNAKEKIKKPAGLEVMLNISRELSKTIPFVRIDYYIVESKVYFGEITFFPSSGFSKFEPEDYDALFGEWINLQNVEKRG